MAVLVNLKIICLFVFVQLYSFSYPEALNLQIKTCLIYQEIIAAWNVQEAEGCSVYLLRKVIFTKTTFTRINSADFTYLRVCIDT